MGKKRFAVTVTHREDGVSLLSLVGDSETRDDARDVVAKAMQRLLAQGRLKIVVDATRLDWMTADVIGAIVGDFLRLREAGGWFVFAGLDDQVGPLLQDLGVLEYVGNTETIDEAVEWLHENVGETGAVSEKRLVVKGEKHPTGVLVLCLHGALDEEDAARLTRYVEKQIAGGVKRVVLDGEKLLDAAGIAELVVLAERAKKLGADLCLSTFWGVPGAIVEVLGLGGVVAIHPDLETALAAGGSGAKKKKKPKKKGDAR